MQPARLSACVLLGASLAAQTNAFVVFPLDPQHQTITCASYVRRPANAAAGEGLQELSDAWFRGIGELGSGGLALGFYYWSADENIATSETYDLILRTADPLGQPDITTAGVIVQVLGLTTPTNPAGGRGSFIMTDTFATPVVLPSAQSWFQGVGFPASPNWPATDGNSLWAADSPALATPPTTGENHRGGAPYVTWRADPISAFRTGWTYLMGVVVTTPVMHIGGIDATSSRTGVAGASSYGMNGLFPDVSHGLDVRVQHGTAAGLALVAGGFGFQTPSLQIPGIGGQLFVDLATMTNLGFAPMSGGVATIPIALPNTLPPALAGLIFTMQAVYVDPSTGAVTFTNAQTTNF